MAVNQPIFDLDLCVVGRFISGACSPRYAFLAAHSPLAAEGLHIDRHAVARLDGAHLGADLLNNANHLVANGYTWNGTRHTAVFDMQVAGADTAERNAHNGIARALQCGLRLVDQLELAGGYVGVGEHRLSFYYLS